VPHRQFRDGDCAALFATLAPGGVLIDVKSAIDRALVPQGITYWSL
jgi:UDP-N-acetyl-D-glucosamine/UDP-N-acetyl-D-galactosamine dehydrogenase